MKGATACESGRMALYFSTTVNIPVVRGVIDRRILVNFRIDPEVLNGLLPAPFRPKTVGGFGIGGVCLIRLTGIRPRGFPSVFGITSENAAHRFAVEWDSEGSTMEGVYVPRRDTSSRLNSFLGGRLFPGDQHHARFDVQEDAGRYRVEMAAHDGGARLMVDGRVAEDLAQGSVFPSLKDASDFFEAGSLGYSASRRAGAFDGMELKSKSWHVEPLDVDCVESSLFDDEAMFPKGSANFDCALLMRDIEHEWHGRDRLCP